MAVRIKTYRAGSAVFREGEVANAAYIVECGRVELSTLGPYGPVLLASLESGQMFGEMDIVTNTPRQSSARAADKSRIKVIPRDDFLDALTQKSDLALRVTRQIVQRLRAGGSLVPSREEMSRPGRSLIGRMISAFKRRREIATVQTPAMPVAFTVLIAAMN
ncbi:MAG: cyclic nucleotide-binding domain-containing protein, partial [Rhodospirillales bacterium]|nr:cyclic nucleotide-binding domain-containing protein [Rhodospirillales bacterium]